MTPKDTKELYSLKRMWLGFATIHAVWGVVGAMLAFILLQAVLRLPPYELKITLMYLIPVGALATSWDSFSRQRRIRPFIAMMQNIQEGTANASDYEDGFRVISNLPLDEFIRGVRFWSLAPATVMLLVSLHTNALSYYSMFLVVMAAFTAGIYCLIFIYTHMKMLLRPYRQLAASGIPDPDRRKSLVKPLTIRTKIGFVVGSLALTCTFFSVSVGQTRILRPLGEFASSGQMELLETRMRDSEKILNPALYGEAAATEAMRRLDAAPIKVELGMGSFLILDREERSVIQGPEDLLLDGEIRAILDADTNEGSSANYNTPHHFSWSALSNPRYLLVVSTPQDAFGFPMRISGWFQTFVVLIAMLLGVAASQYLCSDIDWSVKKLRLHMEEVANGNLRVAAFESEDDLGHLGRNFETMTTGLREIITKVADTADRVEQGSNDIVRSSGRVSLASISQTGDIREVSKSMRNIDDLVKSIADYAVDLNGSVDASSDSIDSLCHTSGGLTQAGQALGGHVQQIATAYERMFETIESVSACTFRFSHAATETSSGMHQMSSALQEVNRNASETSRLSEAVIDSADRGQTKVKETISGIGSIRENTQEVETMIHDFSTKAKQIGSIISVIDDVADETNLLALNAAVIAAQSGEQGRAFSVVADEINELADRVLVSTKEISNLIKSVQQSASDAVVAIARGTASVESGLNLSQEAGSALEEITSSARESGTRMHEVVAAVGEQSRAADHLARMMTEVIEAIKQIEVVSKDQSESTEAVIASNEAMSVAAEQIQESNQEQVRSTNAIKGHINQVRTVTTGISSSLVEEARKVALVGQLLEAVNDSAVTNEESTASMTQAADVLLDEAANLREGIKRFKI